MKQMIKETLIIFAITLIAGACLGAIYMITKNPIEEQKELNKVMAYQTVFPDADTFWDEEDFDSEKAMSDLAKFDPEEDYSLSTIDLFSAAYKGDELLGFVITVTNHGGYGGNISFTMGIRLDGTLNGISITDISETAGLGMKAPDVLVPQFKNKTADAKYTVTKSGAVYATDIDAISSATITSKAVVNGVNAGVMYYQYRLAMYNENDKSVPAFTSSNGNGGDQNE